jgi:hypothetical protein
MRVHAISPVVKHQPMRQLKNCPERVRIKPPSIATTIRRARKFAVKG